MDKRICGVIIAALASAAAGQSITTNFNGPSEAFTHRNAGAFLDITALTGITIRGFDVHCDAPAGQPVRIEVYFSRYPYAGLEQFPHAWFLLGAVDAVSAGPGAPTPVPVGGLVLSPGERRGFYLVHASGGVRFNTAAATTTPVANSHVRLDVGAAQEFLFGGALLSPRGWMGTLRYEVGVFSEIGGCCIQTGACWETTEAGCLAAGGIWRGLHSTCSNVSCPQPPSCCLADGCVMVFPPQCATLGGVRGPYPYYCQTGECGTLDTSGYTVTQLGAGLGGAHLSRASGSTNRLGEPVDAAGGHRLAQEFWAWTFPGWNLSNITVYGLIPAPPGAPYGIPPQSPLTGASVRIWNAPPGSAGAGIVAASQTMLETGWTGVYRVLNQDEPLDPRAPVMAATVDFSGVYLPRGRYWVDYQLSGSHGGSAAVLSPLAMFPLWHPELTQQWFPSLALGAGGWGAVDGDFPIVVRGQVAPVACYANCDGSTIPPVLNVNDFICFQLNFARQDPYANCDGSTIWPLFTVNDFICFQNRFASGCP